MNATATLYDVLGLPPTASEGDIHAAHMRLVRHYQNGIHGLSGAEADQRIQAIKGAWWTLSDPGRRLAYDTGLAAAQALAQAAAAAGQPPAPEASPAAPAAELPPLGVLPPVIEVELKSAKRSPLRIMLGVIGSLMIVGLILQIFFSVFAFRQVAGSGDAALEAQQRLIDAERPLRPPGAVRPVPLGPRLTRRVEAICAPVMSRFGYAPWPAPGPERPWSVSGDLAAALRFGARTLTTTRPEQDDPEAVVAAAQLRWLFNLNPSPSIAPTARALPTLPAR